MRSRIMQLVFSICLLFPLTAFAQDSDKNFIIKTVEWINGYWGAILFWNGLGLPFILIIMLIGGVFFTIRYGFINIRLFRHALDVVRGKYDSLDHQGEITHFQALTAALSATVGLGNIAGVAVAIALGGPGAVFWLWVVAFFWNEYEVLLRRLCPRVSNRQSRRKNSRWTHGLFGKRNCAVEAHVGPFG